MSIEEFKEKLLNKKEMDVYIYSIEINTNENPLKFNRKNSRFVKPTKAKAFIVDQIYKTPGFLNFAVFLPINKNGKVLKRKINLYERGVYLKVFVTSDEMFVSYHQDLQNALVELNEYKKKISDLENELISLGQQYIDY